MGIPKVLSIKSIPRGVKRGGLKRAKKGVFQEHFFLGQNPQNTPSVLDIGNPKTPENLKILSIPIYTGIK